ncbi:MAG: DUF4440 domain-containing protein [Gemmatimonadota bacterium]|nr:DUF4440 domain-containing protein [Gemmatimonadota bacterium]
MIDLDTACRAEVVDLHDFFAAWFEGRLPDEEDAFARVADALAEGFELIGPDGSRRGREEILASIRSNHASHAVADRSFAIRIERVEPRRLGGGLVLATYEEWQTIDGEENGRVSSALFRREPDAPRGVAWIHLHETRLPAGEG